MFPHAPWPLKPAILMYHRIAEESFDPWGLAVFPSRFEAQMRWLARHRTVLPLTEFVRLHASGGLPKNAVAITFDDGYQSVAEIAVPLMERLELAATIFIPASLIDRNREFWWDDLERMIVGCPAETLVCGGEQFELGPLEAGDRIWPRSAPPATRRQVALQRIWSRIRTNPQVEIEGTLSELRDRTGISQEPRSSRRLMTRKELHAINSTRIKFGSHALTHPSLPALSPDQRLIEIRDSIAACEAITGERPSTFAYPFGEYDDEIERLVASCGFSCACTTEGSPVTPDTRATALPRIGVGNWPAELLKRVLVEL